MKTCLNKNCPEYKSVCCGAPSKHSCDCYDCTTFKVNVHFVCSKCGNPFQGGQCTAGEEPKPETMQKDEMYTCPKCKGESTARDGHYDCTPPQKEEWRNEWYKHVDKTGDIGIKMFEESIADWWLDKFLKDRERVKEMIEKEFDSFLLQDWSGEAEVYSEIERLKNQVINSLIK